MSENRGYGGTHLVLAFLAGAAAGAVLGLLAAPRPGRETLETIRGWSREMSQKATRAAARAARAARDAFGEALHAEEPGAHSS